jgi:hypothetical protein
MKEVSKFIDFSFSEDVFAELQSLFQKARTLLEKQEIKS